MLTYRHAVPSLLLLVAAMPAAEVVTPPVVVVGISRLEDPPVQQPYALYRQDQEDLARANQASPVEALDHTPGVYVQKTSGNQSSPYLRGLTGEQTLLMFDGVRLNHATMRPGPNQYSALIPSHAVGEVDVLLGSSGTVQGSDGLTGAVDFRLAEAGRGTTKVASPWVSTRLDSADAQQLSAGVDGTAADFQYSFDAGRSWSRDRQGGKDAGDHLFGNAAGQNQIPNSGFEQFDVGGRAAYVGLAGNRFELSAGRVKQWDAPRADGYFENSGVASRISRYYEPQQFDYVHGRHIFAGAGAMPRVQTTVWLHRHQESQIQEDIQGAGATARYRRREWDDRISTVGLDLQLTSRVSQAHELTYGTTLYEDRTGNVSQVYRSPVGNTSPGGAVFDPTQSTPGTTTVPDGSTYQGVGLFVQDLWSIAPQWELLAGVRWSRSAWNADVTTDRPGYAAIGNTTIDGAASAVTGNARLAYHPVEMSTIFTGISQGFRAPNLSNLTGIQSRASSNIQTEGNPDLKPEKSLTYEVGAKYEELLDSAGLTLFYTDLTDLIQTTYIDLNGDGVINGSDRARSENANSGELAGFELAHDWGILATTLPTDSRLALFNVVNAVTGEAEVENGQGVVETQHISRANRVYGQGGITYEPTEAWYVTCQTRWSMAYKEPAPGDATDVRHTTFGSADGGMPGYAVLDLKAGYRWNKTVRLDGALENLLNHSYREVGSGIDGAGLSGVVRVTARY
jgi:hemoglobin/transferrin/lactoferrin receptor protein